MIFENIGGKTVYIVTKHHRVLEAWAAIRRGLKKSPLLITLDSHTDTRIAFTAYLCRTGKYDPTSGKVEAFLALANKECGKIDFRERESIINAILCLAHDEHIDAAIRAGILDHGYAITYGDFSGTHKNYEDKYDEPTPKVFHVPSACAIGCEANPHDGYWCL